MSLHHDLVDEPESQAVSDKLHELSEEYSHIPPSPGDGRLQFAEGNLGYTMAAEFGDATEPYTQPLSTTGSGTLAGDHHFINGSREKGEANSFAVETISPHNDRVSDWNAASEQMHSVAEISKEPEIYTHLPEVEVDLGAPSRSTVTSNEAQQESRPSSLGGDMLYNAIDIGDGEGHSRQRILVFAAKRCANAIQRNPQDYDALYNWALVLQESADNINADSTGAGKDRLLEEACAKYEAATDICPSLHEAFYNWAIAISDRAKARGRTKEAEDMWKQACKKYERAVQLNHNSPQALNNWGLALQELSGIVSIKDKRSIVKEAIKKFRAAIALQFDFHRAIYNLGTVLYGLAEDSIRSEGQHVGNKELTSAELYSQSAIYVAAAHALKPDYPVYKSALRLVRSKLPLAYLKTGYLSVSPAGNALAPHSDWKRLWFVLDHEAFYQVEKATQVPIGSNATKTNEMVLSTNDPHVNNSHAIRIDIANICGLEPCADLSLPPGPAFNINSLHGQHYLIADTWEEVECWVDAIRLVYTIYLRNESDVLAGIIAG